jgi:hypothetical protein
LIVRRHISVPHRQFLSHPSTTSFSLSINTTHLSPSTAFYEMATETKQRKSVSFSDGTVVVDANGDVSSAAVAMAEKTTAESHSHGTDAAVDEVTVCILPLDLYFVHDGLITCVFVLGHVQRPGKEEEEEVIKEGYGGGNRQGRKR